MSRDLNFITSLTPIRIAKRRVLQHDLDMYAAISGAPPRIVPPEDTETPSQDALSAPAQSRTPARRRRAWSVAVLAEYLGNLQMPQISIPGVKPDVADWVRKLSVHALGRLQQAQDRFQAARSSNRRKAG